MAQPWVWDPTQYPLILVKFSTYLKAWTDTPFKSLSCQISSELPRLYFTEWDIVQWIPVEFWRRWFWTFRVSSEVLFLNKRYWPRQKLRNLSIEKKAYLHRLRPVQKSCKAHSPKSSCVAHSWRVLPATGGAAPDPYLRASSEVLSLNKGFWPRKK